MKTNAFSTIFKSFRKAERVFRGIESNTELVVPSPLTNIKDEVLANEVIHEIYLVIPDKFGQIPTDTLEEWMVYLNDGTISPGTKAPGLRKALKNLRVNTLSNEQIDDYLDYRLESVKSDLENKVDKLLLPLERLDEGMGKRYVKNYSKIYSEGYEAGLDLAYEKGISDEEAKSTFASSYGKECVIGYIRGGLLCAFETAFRMIIMGEPYDLIEKCCRFNRSWIKELEAL